MLLIRQPNNQILTNWYSKPTSSENVLNFLSAHPYHQKINVALGLAKRILQLSDNSFHSENIRTIQKILTKNNYPQHITNNIIKKTKYLMSHNNHQTNNTTAILPAQRIEQQQNPSLSHFVTPPTRQITPPEHHTNSKFSSITYIPQVSDKIMRLVKNCKLDTKIAMKPTKTIKNSIFANQKQKLDKLQKTGVVYKIECAEPNCKIKYIGETKRKLLARKTEHERDFRNRFSPSPKTGLINHSLETNHNFNFSNIEIIDREKNLQKRRIIESSHIVLNSPNTCNLQHDTNNLHTNYRNTLDIYRNISPQFNRNRNTNINNNNNDANGHRST